MTPERWAEIEEIFQAALDYPPTARASFVKKQAEGQTVMFVAADVKLA